MRNTENKAPIEREITDLQLIGKVISSLFPRIPVSMYHENEQTPVQIISANQEGIVIKGTDRIDKGIRILTFTNNFSLYHFWFELMPGSNVDIEFLKPMKMVIRDDAKRIESRVVVTKKAESEDKIFINSIISNEELLQNTNKIASTIQPIWDSRSKSILHKFTTLELKLDAIDNIRMTIFRSSQRPIFLPKPGSLDPFNTAFFNPVQYKELLNTSSDPNPIVGAEITIPILFRDKILLGYIRATHISTLSMEDFQSCSSIAGTLISEINSHEELINVHEKCEVIDISSSGIGFLVSNSDYHQKLLANGAILFFNIQILGEKIPMKAVVRYASKDDNKTIRIGCEFYDLTLDEKAKMRELSKSLSQTEPSKEK
jgi:hypothetical protein